MPSPFPGMDPYLEAKGLWPDFHHRFATEISNELNMALPDAYYAQLELRQDLGILQDGGKPPRIVPDVAVVRHPRPSPFPRAGTALLERPRRALSPGIDLIISYEKVPHPFIEIRETTRGHKLVTLIEILSPSNKYPGPDYEAYLRKRREIVMSDANLIEIDLLRSGQRLAADMDLAATLVEVVPRPDYLVLVYRAWKRGERTAVEVFGSMLREWLPCIPVPLKQEEPEVPLDLQFVFNRTYEGGPYRRGAVDYSRPPVPPLSEADAAWADAWLREHPGFQAS